MRDFLSVGIERAARFLWKKELLCPFLGCSLAFLGYAVAPAWRDIPIAALHHALRLRLELLDHGIR